MAVAAQLVDRKDAVFLLVELNRELPALDFEDDSKDVDALGLGSGDEFGVADKAVHPESRFNLAPRLLLQPRQGDRPATECRPDERRRPVGDQVIDHPQAAWRQAGVIVMLAG